MRYWLQDWCVIGFSGPDRLHWLQGQITQDVFQKEKPAFCWCDVHARLISFGLFVDIETETVLCVPRDTLPAIHQRFAEMVIMEDISMSERSEPVLWTPFDKPSDLTEIGNTWGTFSLFGSPYTNREDTRKVAAHLEAGFPQWQIDIGNHSHPFDMGQAFMLETVSSNKGCYIGQEIMARIQASGKFPRQWVGLRSSSLLLPGDLIGTEGRITSSAVSDSLGCIAAASISKRTASEGEIVEVTTESGMVEAEVRHMPLLRRL